MRYKLIFGFWILSSFVCNAQMKKEFIPKPNWNKGETKTMMITRSYIRESDGKEQFSKDTSNVYFIEVLDKTEQGYILKIHPDIDVDGVDDSPTLQNYASNLNYVISVDTLGIFKELVNYESLITLYKSLRKEVMLEAKKEKVDESDLDEVFSMLDVLETKEGLTIACTEITKLFMGIYGTTLRLNDTIRRNDTIFTPRTNDPIPVIFLTATKILSDDMLCVTYLNVYDSAMEKEFYEKYSSGVNPEEIEFPHTDYFFNIKTGWVENIRVSPMYIEYENTKKTVIIERSIK